VKSGKSTSCRGDRCWLSSANETSRTAAGHRQFRIVSIGVLLPLDQPELRNEAQREGDQRHRPNDDEARLVFRPLIAVEVLRRNDQQRQEKNGRREADRRYQPGKNRALCLIDVLLCRIGLTIEIVVDVDRDQGWPDRPRRVPSGVGSEMVPVDRVVCASLFEITGVLSSNPSWTLLASGRHPGQRDRQNAIWLQYL
jgi:hypothetical protein